MPFPKFAFKKSRQQYNVASKSVFVLTVELLDSAILECTLSAESTGRDCMDNVCQRLGLQQPDLFGLKYVSRRSYPKIRWVDLDRPLKKQLDKYSTEPYLYLGVIFYVTDVSLLEDEVTRYHYFLQLKMDVVEGRLRCNYEQAIVLASYSLQAEFGDHDPEKHTAEYLKDFPLLPKPMISQFEDRLGALTDAVVTQHASLTGIAQQLAEIYYIVGAQQLEGYGQECFLAKDDGGNEVLLGASLVGICVRRGNGQAPQFFKWNDITNLVNHKRYFGIECQHFEFRISSVQFVFDEPEAAKYVWKMCVLQHTFYKMHQSATENSEMNITLSPQPSVPSLEQEYLRAPPGPGSIKHADIANFQRQSQNIPAKVELQAGHSSTAPTETYSVSGRRPARQTKGGTRHQTKHQRPSTAGSVHSYLQSNTSLNMTEPTSRLSGARSANDLDQLSQTVPHPPTYRPAPDRDLDQLSQTGPHLPTYRPAPDYDTAMMSKYGPTQSTLAHLYSSHPDIRQPHPDLTYRPPSPPKYHFPLHSTYSTPDLNKVENSETSPTPLTLYRPPPPYPEQARLHNPFSSSTPDLASQTMVHGGQVGGSSPDLVSRKTLGNAAHSAGQRQSGIPVSPAPGDVHRTYDNLANYADRSSDNIDNYRHLAYSTEELNVVYNINGQQSEDDHQLLIQNIINDKYKYGVPIHHPSHLPPHLQQLQQIDTQQLALLQTHQQNNSESEEISEPIYQNQGQILAQQIDSEQLVATSPVEETVEPIYQNLPLHEKLLLEQQLAGVGDSDSDSVVHIIDDTVEGLDLGREGIRIDRSPEEVSGYRSEKVKLYQSEEERLNRTEEIRLNRTEEDGLMGVNSNLVSSSRLSVTTSREDLGLPDDIKLVQQQPRRKLEMRQYLEPAVRHTDVARQDETLIDSVNSGHQISMMERLGDKVEIGISNIRKKSATSIGSGEELSSSSSSLHQGGRSKGRKKWSLNMTAKSGSLKSNKSDKSDGGSKSAEEGRSSGRGMLAHLHGLTRSRPDILTESFANAFTAPTKIPKESIGTFLETKLSEGEVVREFEKIPKKKVAGCNFTVANMVENLTRNRFKDVVPYDENRVKIINDKENKYGYVNASHISATVGSAQRFYIAAQGPLPNTVHNFWSMVQECDVHLIVMLTEVSGASKASACIPYWPQNDGSSLEIGDFTITKKFSSDSGSYTTTTLQLIHLPSKRTRTVWHLQYSGWQDHGCPDDVTKYLSFMEELSALRRLTVAEMAVGQNRNTPVLVHCSAGVGRTGVTILSDILLYCADHNIDIDIPKVLTHLRHQRMLMVQTVAQYKFVHTTLIHYLGQSRLI